MKEYCAEVDCKGINKCECGIRLENMIRRLIKPSKPGWYWRRRLNDGRSTWKPILIPSPDAERIDPTATYEYVGPIPEPSPPKLKKR